ncbi:MAG: hypothetical protein LQ342_003990 [Letrouitia transgressa]|nr:MAG: hypothetical protein LQ342_003990 [Letrouitia transgressa]
MHLSTSFLALASAVSLLVAPTLANAPTLVKAPWGKPAPKATKLPDPGQAIYHPIPISDPVKRRAAALEKRYENGWCTMHFTQYEKNNGGRRETFAYDLRVYDDIQRLVGGINGVELPDYKEGVLLTDLEHPLLFQSGVIRSDPILFRYDKEVWSTSDKHCFVGKYDGGNRDGDCGFRCGIQPQNRAILGAQPPLE